MGINDPVLGAELGPEFDVDELIQSGKVRLKLGSGLAIQVDGTIVRTTSTIYSEFYYGRSSNGTTQSSSRNATINRTNSGRWDVVLASPHPDGVQYHISLTTEEQAGLRDTPDITIVQDSQTANGFSIQITTGDNGGTADSYVDAPWSFAVTAPVSV